MHKSLKFALSLCALSLLLASGAFSAQSSQDRPIRGGVLNGKAVKLAKPAYPPEAKEAKAEGIVKVEVVIDEDGKVISAVAVEGHELLRAASVAAAYASKFSPTTLSGRPVKVSGTIVYNFVADK